ncbi:GPI-anchored wall transfer protein [Quillaja saponaria]|uniref:GPI-anchored wall transfer protein n=1 Tax=Quillaja saponaria TaxID=32244 RepID=A0AAD7KQM2_QUISA|nr:GPI-anchored wall transfer protein [Quillaja saponaria]
MWAGLELGREKCVHFSVYTLSDLRSDELKLWRAIGSSPQKIKFSLFVSNLRGSSMLEIVALSTTIPILILIRHSISYNPIFDASLKKNDNATAGSKNLRAYMASLSLDFVVVVLPTLLFFTVLADWTYIWAILFTVSMLLYLAAKRSGASLSSQGEPDTLRAYISSYRVVVMIITFLCILAVDFRIFPRRYAKTETYGISLMDLGVGSFVLANSLVSRQARNVSAMNWKSAVRSISPLIILGFIRLVTTMGVDYQVHVGEYGVHWNFFFTLAAVSILTTLINIPPQYSGILGLVVLVGYQFCLMQGLNSYLLSNERGMDIISQNKEGLFSIFGYWGMYLVGVHLGNYLFFERHRRNRWARTRIWILSLLFWLLAMLLDRHVERISRRTCNIAYVTVVLADNLQVLSVIMLADFIPGSKTSVLEEAFNRNLLATFLLANVLTGLVNLSVNTLIASSAMALCILFVYAYVLSTLIGVADFYGVKLKFW